MGQWLTESQIYDIFCQLITWPFKIASWLGIQRHRWEASEQVAKRIQTVRRFLPLNLVPKLTLSVGLVLLVSIFTWAYFIIEYQQKKVMQEVLSHSDRLGTTIKLGTHYAMMLNSRDDINQIITNIGKQKEIETVRIYNKSGEIKFSNRNAEVDQVTNIKAEACDICHRSDPPLVNLVLPERTRVFRSPEGTRLLGIISPIYNEPGCSTDSCHFHPADKQVLGALDLVVSLAASDHELGVYRTWLLALAVFVFVAASALIFFFVWRFVNRPVKRLITGTHQIAKGSYDIQIGVEQSDELGQLSSAIQRMGHEIGQKQTELNRQKDEYQHLFELVPCIITIQDHEYRLIGYNNEFSQKFAPKPGDHCYKAYKGREQKCEICPVERTFEDGTSHYSEETGYSKDGVPTHWLVKTSPVKNADGEIVAAMEMSIDITHRKQLEQKLAKSEKKYHAIFNNIPNPVFVLDVTSLEILDCNDSVAPVYGYAKHEIIGLSFLDLFRPEDRESYARTLPDQVVLNRVKHMAKGNIPLYVNIRISPSEYPGQKVLLVTTSDVTKRLETEQQLIQAGKMATLGEMATGVAHELNQPLSVIKTASNFFMKKIRKKEPINDDIMLTMASEIDGHVDRATRIINHMRQFGRKTDMDLEPLQVNDILRRAFDIFSQQLKVRGIEVVWQMTEPLPLVLAEPSRLEQVFINLLINGRDAIEEKCEQFSETECVKQITLKTEQENHCIRIMVQDSGIGITKTIADKIFDPFFTTKKVGKGTGLGLSISYGIIKECNGDIWAEAVPDGGTAFIITLPLPAGQAGTPDG